MFTIGWYELALLVSTMLLGTLAALAILLPSRRSPAAITFALLNLAGAASAMGAFLNTSLELDAALLAAEPTTSGWWVALLVFANGALLPIAWFLFSAAQTRHPEQLRGGWLAACLTWIAAWYALVMTNPYTGLLIAGGSTASAPKHGPLFNLLIPIALTVIVYSLARLVRSHLRSASQRERRVGVALAVTGALPVLGAAAWSARGLMPFATPGDPALILSILPTLVLAYDVFQVGLADIIPIAASRAFSSTADMALVIDPKLHVLTVNDATERELPDARTGMQLDEVLPEAVAHVHACEDDGVDQIPFELQRGQNVYWGRVHCIRRNRMPVGYVILLSDISDLRYAQEQLLRLTQARDGETVVTSKPVL